MPPQAREPEPIRLRFVVRVIAGKPCGECSSSDWSLFVGRVLATKLEIVELNIERELARVTIAFPPNEPPTSGLIYAVESRFAAACDGRDLSREEREGEQAERTYQVQVLDAEKNVIGDVRGVGSRVVNAIDHADVVKALSSDTGRETFLDMLKQDKAVRERENLARERFEEAKAAGLSDAEARAEGWPNVDEYTAATDLLRYRYVGGSLPPLLQARAILGTLNRLGFIDSAHQGNGCAAMTVVNETFMGGGPGFFVRCACGGGWHFSALELQNLPDLDIAGAILALPKMGEPPVRVGSVDVTEEIVKLRAAVQIEHERAELFKRQLADEREKVLALKRDLGREIGERDIARGALQSHVDWRPEPVVLQSIARLSDLCAASVRLAVGALASKAAVLKAAEEYGKSLPFIAEAAKTFRDEPYAGAVKEPTRAEQIARGHASAYGSGEGPRVEVDDHGFAARWAAASKEPPDTTRNPFAGRAYRPPEEVFKPEALVTVDAPERVPAVDYVAFAVEYVYEADNPEMFGDLIADPPLLRSLYQAGIPPRDSPERPAWEARAEALSSRGPRVTWQRPGAATATGTMHSIETTHPGEREWAEGRPDRDALLADLKLLRRTRLAEAHERVRRNAERSSRVDRSDPAFGTYGMRGGSAPVEGPIESDRDELRKPDVFDSEAQAVAALEVCFGELRLDGECAAGALRLKRYRDAAGNLFAVALINDGRAVCGVVYADKHQAEATPGDVAQARYEEALAAGMREPDAHTEALRARFVAERQHLHLQDEIADILRRAASLHMTVGDARRILAGQGEPALRCDTCALAAALHAGGFGPASEPRCVRCRWPLAASRAVGCIAGDCSYRCDCGPNHRGDCRLARADGSPAGRAGLDGDISAAVGPGWVTLGGVATDEIPKGSQVDLEPSTGNVRRSKL